ncbi:MAG: hypothetical protein ABL898_18745 [Hyphomicrobiaceae bacterium]
MLDEAADKVIFDALRNAIYHALREAFFGAWHRRLLFLIIATGTSGATGLFEKVVSAPLGGSLVAGAAALFAAAELAYDPKGRSSDHQKFKEKYFEIWNEAGCCDQISAEKLKTWRQQMNELTAQEPKSYRALDSQARNQAIDGTQGYNADDRIKLCLIVSLTSNWIPYSNRRFLTVTEYQAAKILRRKYRRSTCRYIMRRLRRRRLISWRGRRGRLMDRW